MFLAYSHTIPYVSSEISVVMDKSIKQKKTNFERQPAHLTLCRNKYLHKRTVFVTHIVTQSFQDDT